MPAPPAFHEIAFPLSVGFGSTGGPMRRTDVVTLASGHEARNGRWADSRRRYDAGTGIRTLDDLHTVIAFFEARRGRLHGFRFRDPVDHKSCVPSAAPAAGDQVLGAGDGARAIFALVKRYGTGDTAWERAIAKPVAGSVRVAVDGVERVAGSDFTVDAMTGLVAFAPGAAPPAGSQITAGFLFDVPVRFDADEIRIDLSAFAAGEIPSIPLIEIRV